MWAPGVRPPWRILLAHAQSEFYYYSQGSRLSKVEQKENPLAKRFRATTVNFTLVLD